MPGAASMVPQEHAYAAAMVSANAYYGYHRQHQDCSMDTSESSLPASGPSHPGLGLNPNNGQHQHQPSRKRRPTGPGLGNAHDEEDDAAVSVKRTKCCAGENVYGHTDDIHSGAAASAQTQNLSQGFGVQSSTPSIASAPMYDLPIHQLPGSTSQLADMTPRPRCLMGHFI